MNATPTAPDPFSLLGLPPRPWLDPDAIDSAFTQRAAASHPDQHPTPEAKAHAVRIAADLANAHRTLKKISSRLGALL
ncbi:MAG: hypothetical protein SNJ84_05940, partial [Verrucomicrobiia bacterium]